MDAHYYGQLPDDAKRLADEIETRGGCEIIVRFVSDAELERRFPEIPVARSFAFAWNEGHAAIIAFRGPSISREALVHELLHHHWTWVLRRPDLAVRSGMISGLNNDLQHLYVIPRERELVGFREEHWRHEYLDNALHDFASVPASFHRQRACVKWLVAFSIFGKVAEDSPLWRELHALGLAEAAARYTKAARRTGGDDMALLRLTAELGPLPKAAYLFAIFDPVSGNYSAEQLWPDAVARRVTR